MFLLRTWILYFEIHFNLAKKDIIWQKHLYLNYLSPSNKYSELTQDWFLENKATAGSAKWMFWRILFVPYTISAIICMYALYTTTKYVAQSLKIFYRCIGLLFEADYYENFWYQAINGVLISIPILGILIIYRKINPIHDFYRIRSELRITIISWFCLIALTAVTFLICNFFISERNDARTLFAVLSSWYLGILLTINGLTSTAWIYHLTKNKHFEYSREYVEYHMDKLTKTVIKMQRGSSSPSNNIDDASTNSATHMVNNTSVDDSRDERSVFSTSKTRSKDIQIAEKIYSTFPLRDILNTENGFRLFMQHMFSDQKLFYSFLLRQCQSEKAFLCVIRTSEYNAESLLFLVEIVRYKYAMNGFKRFEMYSTCESSSGTSEIDDELVWFMPLPESLLDDVVKPPNATHQRLKSVQINDELKDELHLKKHSSVKSMTQMNPLFHANVNIDSVAQQDGTLNEIKSWDDVEIAWGTLSHALMIYEKYIRMNALFEINISHRLRTKMKNEFEDLKKLYLENEEEIISDKLEDIMKGIHKFSDNIRIYAKYPEKREELLKVFDGTAKRIENLMNDSYSRFRQTQTYHRLLKQLIKEQRKKGKQHLNADNFLSKAMSAD